MRFPRVDRATLQPMENYSTYLTDYLEDSELGESAMLNNLPDIAPYLVHSSSLQLFVISFFHVFAVLMELCKLHSPPKQALLSDFAAICKALWHLEQWLPGYTIIPSTLEQNSIPWFPGPNRQTY